jgi:hypothetical protein
MKWYTENANNPLWIKALADVRRMGTARWLLLSSCTGDMIAIDQYSETALAPKPSAACSSLG